MARTPKEAPKSSPPKEAPRSAPPKAVSDDPQVLLQAARAETMRAQRDLESVRLELVEQKRKSSQHALVHAEELKEARAEREQLRMQIVALKGELADLSAPGKKRNNKREAEEDGRAQDLETELAEVRVELQKERAAVARLQKAQAETQAVLAEARRNLESRPPPPRMGSEPPPGQVSSTPPPMAAELEAPAPVAPAAKNSEPVEPIAPPAAAAAPAPAPPHVPAPEAAPQAPEPQRGFFSKLFGRRTAPN